MNAHQERYLKSIAIRESIAKELEAQNPNIEIIRYDARTVFLYFVPYFSEGQVKFRKYEMAIHEKMPDVSKFYLTRHDANNAIKPHIELAKSKFRICSSTLNELQKSLGFEVCHVVEGDTHGITDYMSIDFKHAGFDFSFELSE